MIKHFILFLSSFKSDNDPMYNCEVLYYLYKFEIAFDEIEKVNIVTGNTAIFRHMMARASHIVWCVQVFECLLLPDRVFVVCS